MSSQAKLQISYQSEQTKNEFSLCKRDITLGTFIHKTTGFDTMCHNVNGINAYLVSLLHEFYIRSLHPFTQVSFWKRNLLFNAQIKQTSKSGCSLYWSSLLNDLHRTKWKLAKYWTTLAKKYWQLSKTFKIANVPNIA